MPKLSRIRGFTLIELSIVLVIIGLIVGGVLVGRDLIRAAEIRAQISQIEKLNTAVVTFRLKYNALPGDILAAQAASYGLFSCSSGCGNNDGMILLQTARNYFGGEHAMFWRHLSETNLIDGNYAQTGSGAGQILIDATVAVGPSNFAEMNALVPPAKTGNNASISQGYADRNYFMLSGITAMSSVQGDPTASTNTLTGTDAYNIDIKMDDGAPATGSVFAINGAGNGLRLATTWLAVSALPACVTGTAYTLNSTSAGCSLRFKMSQ